MLATVEGLSNVEELSQPFIPALLATAPYVPPAFPGNPLRHSQFLPTATYVGLLTWTRERIGVSQRQMSRLLGVSFNGWCEWTRGYRRPSSFYMARLICLIRWQDEGIELARVRSINWPSGEVERGRDGKKTADRAANS